MTVKPGRALSRYTVMKLALLALVVFMLGIAPGLKKYAGPPPQVPSPRQLAQRADFQAQHPLLAGLAETLKLRL